MKINIKNHHVAFFLFLLVMVIFAKTFSTESLIYYNDAFFPLNMQGDVSKFFSAWSSDFLGSDSSNQFQIAPVVILVYLLQLILPGWLAIRILFAVPIFLIGYFTYLLSLKVFQLCEVRPHTVGGQNKKIAAALAAFFSIFNPLIVNYIYAGNWAILLAFAMMILFLTLLIDGIEKRSLVYVFYLALLSVFINHVVVLIFVFILFFLYLLFSVFSKTANRKWLLKFGALFAVLAVLFNFYWILPVSWKVMGGDFISQTFPGGSAKNILLSNRPYGAVMNVGRLVANNEFFERFYMGTLEISAGLILLAVIYSVLLFRRRFKYETFFLLLALGSTFFAIGITAPFGFVYQFLWDYLPLFSGFRAPSRFLFFTLPAYSILIGFFYLHFTEYWVEKVSQKVKNKTQKTTIINASIIVFLVVFMLISSWPLLTGNMLGQIKTIRIPDEYFALKEKIDGGGDFANTLILPYLDYYYYQWINPKAKTEFESANPVFENVFFTKPVFYNGSGFFCIDKNTYCGLIFRYLRKKELDGIGNILSLINVKDIILHKDYFINMPNHELKPYGVNELKEKLEKTDDIDFVEKFKNYLNLYRLSNNYFVPRVFIPKNLNYVKATDKDKIGKIENVLDPLNNPHYRTGDAFVFETAAEKAGIARKEKTALKQADRIFLPLNFDSMDKKGEAVLDFNLKSKERSDYDFYLKSNVWRISYDKKSGNLVLSDPFNVYLNDKKVKNKEADKYQINLSLNLPDVSEISYYKQRFKVSELADDSVVSLIYLNTYEDTAVFDVLNSSLVFESSFDNFSLNGWSFGDCSANSPGGPSMSKKIIAGQRGGYAVKITSENHTACLMKDIKEVEQGGTYGISFDFKRVSGRDTAFVVIGSDMKGSVSSGGLTNVWSRFTKTFKISDNADSAQVVLYFASPDKGSSVNLIDNIRVYRIEKSADVKIKIDKMDRFAGRARVNEGKQKAKAKLPLELTNFLANPSFEISDNSWSFGDCSSDAPGEPQISKAETSDASEGEYAFEIRSRNHTACLIQTINDVYPNADYRFYLDYKYVAGREAAFVILGSDMKKSVTVSGEKSEEGKWSRFEKTVKTLKDTESLVLVLYFSSDGIEESVNLIDNVGIILDVKPKMIAVTERNKNRVSPEIDFERISYSKYKVKIKNAGSDFPLALMESYSGEWKAYPRQPFVSGSFLKKGLKKLSGNFFETWFAESVEEKNHFVINAYANGWWIERPYCFTEKCRDFEIILEYRPQRLFYVGLLVSILSMILAFVLLNLRLRQKRIRNKE